MSLSSEKSPITNYKIDAITEADVEQSSEVLPQFQQY